MPHVRTAYETDPTGSEPPLLTIDALARLLSVDRKTIYRLPIPYVIVGARRRFRLSDVEAYLDARRVAVK